MNTKYYKTTILHRGKSVFSSGEETSGEKYWQDLADSTPLLKAFCDDDDIQEMTVTSASIGFTRTYTKQYAVVERAK
jgi:hypothetical protein